MKRAKIVGVGAYAPKRVLTNAELEKMVETSDEWIVQRTGIRERRIADESEATSDLALRAAQQALERAGVEPGEIDFIVVGTTTGDMAFPTTANILQHRLGCRNAGSIDLYAACAGSVYSLGGVVHIQTEKYRTVLRSGVPRASPTTPIAHVHPPPTRQRRCCARRRTSPDPRHRLSGRPVLGAFISRAAARGTPPPTRPWTSACTTPR
jgi:3-oxoacyl-(acyl-carrier-protein) synthase III